MLEKTEETINNWQSREMGDIGTQNEEKKTKQNLLNINIIR